MRSRCRRGTRIATCSLAFSIPLILSAVFVSRAASGGTGVIDSASGGGGASGGIDTTSGGGGASGGIDTASGGGGDINSVRGTNAFGSGAWEYVASWRWDLDQ